MPEPHTFDSMDAEAIHSDDGPWTSSLFWAALAWHLLNH
jgi:hypothetical protein